MYEGVQIHGATSPSPGHASVEPLPCQPAGPKSHQNSSRLPSLRSTSPPVRLISYFLFYWVDVEDWYFVSPVSILSSVCSIMQ